MRARMILVGTLAATGCGPSVAEDAWPLTCGTREPVQLSWDVSNLVTVSVARTEDRLVLDALMPIGFDDRWVAAVGPCGEDPTVLEAPTTVLERVGVAGGVPLLANVETGHVRWLDPHGRAPSHTVFEQAVECLFEVSGGLVAQDAAGDLWFHPDPGDPSRTSQRILEGAVVAEQPDDLPVPALTRCKGLPGERPIVDGDGIVVAERGGPLVRVALPSGERETLVEGPVGEVVAFDDPRYLLWRGGGPTGGDCCSLNALDRETGTSTAVASGTIPEDVRWAGTWIDILTQDLPPDSAWRTTFLDVASGQSITVDDWWTIEDLASPTALLVEHVGEPAGRALVDTTTGVLTPIDFPALGWPPWLRPTYDDGLIGLDLPTDDAAYGRLMRLPADGGPVEVLDDHVHRSVLRTRTGTIITFEDIEPFPVAGTTSTIDEGTMIAISRSGERRVVAEGVLLPFVTIPGRGTDHERAELVYLVAPDHPDAGVWRFEVP